MRYGQKDVAETLHNILCVAAFCFGTYYLVHAFGWDAGMGAALLVWFHKAAE